MTEELNTCEFYLALAEEFLQECDESLELCEMINDYLECFYDDKPKPSEELEKGWAW